LKARDNPFATHRVESLLAFDPAWLDTTWEAILNDLRKHDYRAAIVGPHGTGKTTFLDALCPKLLQLGFEIRRYFFNDQRSPARISPAPPDSITIVDGAERLSFLERRRLLKTCPRLLLTQHRRSTLPHLIETKSTPAMLQSFAQKLAPELAIAPDLLYQKHHGNLREALRECYDLAHAQ
jgi:hypothetical protein